MTKERKNPLKKGEKLYRIVYRARLSDGAPVLAEVNLKAFKDKSEIDFEKIVTDYLKIVTGGYILLDEILSSDIIAQ